MSNLSLQFSCDSSFFESVTRLKLFVAFLNRWCCCLHCHKIAKNSRLRRIVPEVGGGTSLSKGLTWTLHGF
jgi:hypothetical protein